MNVKTRLTNRERVFVLKTFYKMLSVLKRRTHFTSDRRKRSTTHITSRFRGVWSGGIIGSHSPFQTVRGRLVYVIEQLVQYLSATPTV